MNRLLCIMALVVLVGCKEEATSAKKEVKIMENVVTEAKNNYPEAIAKIFEAHGGLALWKEQRTLSYTMPKPTGNETQTIDLYTRQEKILTPDFSMGFNGKDFWLVDEQKMYKGDPIFYHNLMFYFYAMPFVLADDGIRYSATENLEYDGKTYPGIRISYDDGVGVSSKDEYFIHYDADTNQMRWLGYTVTYRSGERSDNIRWIRYNDWQNLNGLVVPKSMTWHKVEEGKIMEAASTRYFENVLLSKAAKAVSFYEVPANAEIIKKE